MLKWARRTTTLSVSGVVITSASLLHESLTWLGARSFDHAFSEAKDVTMELAKAAAFKGGDCPHVKCHASLKVWSKDRAPSQVRLSCSNRYRSEVITTPLTDSVVVRPRPREHVQVPAPSGIFAGRPAPLAAVRPGLLQHVQVPAPCGFHAGPRVPLAAVLPGPGGR